MRKRNIAQSAILASVLSVMAPVVFGQAAAKPQAAPAAAPAKAPAAAPARAPAAAPAAPAPAAPTQARPNPTPAAPRPAPASPGDTGDARAGQRPITSNGRNDPPGAGDSTTPGRGGTPDARTNPIGVAPSGLGVNPPNGAGPLDGRGQAMPPTGTGRDTIPNNGLNSADGQTVNDRGDRRGRRNRGGNQPYVIIPNNFSPWGWYNSPGWYWQYGDDYRNYWGNFNDTPNNYQSGASASTPPPVAPAPTPVPQPVAPASPAPAQDQARALNALEASPAYRQAVADLATAEEEQTLANRKVIDQLKKNPEYTRLLSAKQAATGRVEAVQASARVPASPDEIAAEKVLPAAQAKLNIGTELTRMEQEAVAADPAASAARARLTQAQQRVAQMRKAAQTNAVGG